MQPEERTPIPPSDTGLPSLVASEEAGLIERFSPT